jgi:hypothetical protein
MAGTHVWVSHTVLRSNRDTGLVPAPGGASQLSREKHGLSSKRQGPRIATTRPVVYLFLGGGVGFGLSACAL